MFISFHKRRAERYFVETDFSHKMKNNFALVLFLFALNIYDSASMNQTFTLELLQVVFRHGDRVPNESDMYLKDPYAGLFKSIGYRNLLNVGKEREYKIGQVLRQRYDQFLGDYKESEVYAYSTDNARTKQSLDLALAGLYPPTDKSRWSNSILWSPIPTHYNLTQNDILRSYSNCQLFRTMFSKAMNSTKIQREFRKHQLFLDYVGRNTGNRTDNVLTIYRIHNDLSTILGLGLPLPAWCSEADYERIREITSLFYDAAVLTPLLSRITVGLFIERFLSNIRDHESKPDRKIYLYSAHKLNVGLFSKVHNFTNVPGVADFGSTYVIEKLRGRDGRIYIRMFMWTGVSEQWIPVKLRDCDCECPLSDYVRIMNWTFPNEKEAALCYAVGPRCSG